MAESLIERTLRDTGFETESTVSTRMLRKVRTACTPRRTSVIVCLIVFALTASVLTATFQPSANDPTDREASQKSAGIVKNQTSVVNLGIGEPSYLDPAVDYETGGGEVIMNVYETLIWYEGNSTTSYVPVLATEVPSLTNGLISPDGFNYTFNLKNNVRFHDNTTMTADDVVYSIVRALRIHDWDGPSWMLEQIMTDYISFYVGNWLVDFKASSYNAPWVLDAIGGTADDYIITEQDVQNVSEAAVVKADSDTVIMRLTHPYPAFLSIAAYTVMSIVSRTFVEAHGGVVNGEHNVYMDEHTCGTGPYMLVSWDYGVGIHLARFADYHGTPAHLNDVYINVEYDENVRIRMLQEGDADTAYIPIDNESLFANNSDFEVMKGEPTFTIDCLGFNLFINTSAAGLYGSTVPADFFTDPNIRKAFAHLMDVQGFINDYLKGNGMQPNGPIPAGMLGYNASAPVYDFDRAGAIDLLKAAPNPGTGRSWWVDGFTVAIFYNAGNVLRETACQYLKQGLESLNSEPGKHGDFAATINALDWPTYLTLSRYPSPFPIYFCGWAPDYADPDDYMWPFLYSYGTYPMRTRYSNPTIDALILAAASELNTTLREGMYDQITSLCYDDAPYIWLDQHLSFHVQRSWLNGYLFNPMYPGIYYAALWKSNDPPNALFQIDPPAGPTITIFAFDASTSNDPNEDDTLLEVRWDWENDSTWDTDWSTNKTATHQYSSEGSYSVAMEIRDSVGLTNVTYMTVVVDDAIPEFSSAIVPVLFIVAIVAATRLIKKRRS